MTDMPLAPTDLATDGDDELVFDDVAPVAPIKTSRRTPAKGCDAAAGAKAPAAELPPSAAPDEAAAEEPADPPAPLPRPDDGPAGSAPFEPAPRDRTRLILLAIVGLALFTSLMSLGGLIAVSRTLASAQAERDRARDERAELAKLPGMVAALDRASNRLAAAVAHVDASPAARPAPASPGLTADDFHHGLDALRLALDGRQPAGVKALGDTLHSDFNEIGVRLDRIDARLPRPMPPRPAAAR